MTAVTREDELSSGKWRCDADYRNPLDSTVPSPEDRPPLCGEREFAALLEGMVAEFAPRVFAVVQEYGDRVDGRIAAWGIAFADHVEVVDVDGCSRMHLRSPESALRGFSWGRHITARLVWVTRAAATPCDDG